MCVDSSATATFSLTCHMADLRVHLRYLGGHLSRRHPMRMTRVVYAQVVRHQQVPALRLRQQTLEGLRTGRQMLMVKKQRGAGYS